MTRPYGDAIDEHFRRPRNYGSLEAPDLRHEGFNPLCGDRVRFEVSVANGVITAVRFQGDLCMIAKAASSLLTEMADGAALADIAALDERRLLDALQAEIRPARIQCVRLPLETLRTAITTWHGGASGHQPV